ncbi:hypothetical protein DFH07DRAFT_922886 [Mycena maculata]|uniref:Transmembrane protein n=1 Tax=Mycena maculata TaxID=230809 RepID=A0AAD7ITI3_9AGAR|nr:hypothetical protein DFH07DRAFT_922886 [Mycena maculata]
MSHLSPAPYLVWSIISSILFAFLLYHLWSFDRFQCLKWNNGPYSGAFKRVMTYSYMLSVPLLMTFAFGFAIIKYQQGFVEFEGSIIAMPYTMWPESARRAIFPLTLAFSVGWSLEMITHLEELCFWLFLVNAGSVQQDWFRSWYFRTWIFGSIVATIYMPLLTILTRADPLQSEAYTFLGGSIGSLSLTLWFTPILWAFPAFLGSLKAEGVDTATIVRLTKFHELNTIRVVFRFIFVVPLVILGADGVSAHSHVNESMLWTDFLTIIAAFGLCISSALTLVIFFPRSVEGEIAAKKAARERKRNRSYGGHPSSIASQARFSQDSYSQNGHPDNQYQMPSPTKQRFSFPPSIQEGHAAGSNPSPQSMQKEWEHDEADLPSLTKVPIMRPNRRRGDDVEMGGFSGGLMVGNTLRRPPNINPLVHNFTSPIDLYNGEKAQTRLTFTQR